MVKKKREEIILVIDDSVDTLEMLHRTIEHMGFNVYSCESAEEAFEFLKEQEVDLVVTDYHMPFVSGLDLIHHIRENYQNTEVMMITGYASVEGAVEAIKAGAEEYLAKPFTDEELGQAIERSLEKLCIRQVKKPETEKDIAGYYGLFGESEVMKRIFNLIRKAAASEFPVFITGEPGPEKELAARIIHYEGQRSGQPFIHVNCRAVPESILENELFGFLQTAEPDHGEGSDNSCTVPTVIPGLLELAGSGTVYFDEVGATSLAVQVKLLRVIAEKLVTPTGDSSDRKVNCRIIASTTRDLLELSGKGLFREDLFFRLNSLNVALPPLRERGSDPVLLCREYFSRECRSMGINPVPEFDDHVTRYLISYPWPGNLVELEMMMAVLAGEVEGDRVAAALLPEHLKSGLEAGEVLAKTLEEVELEHITKVLKNCDGNKTRAAAVLGIDRKTLRDRLSRNDS